MARVLILSTNNTVDYVQQNIEQTINSASSASNTFADVNSILDRTFCTDCPDCIAKFTEDISTTGLFKCLWEPLVFKRNQAKFFHSTNKYYLELTVDIIDPGLRMARNTFITHFAGIVTLKIEDKYCPENTKTIKLFDLWCNTNDISMKQAYVNKMRDYLIKTFGIDINAWNEITKESTIIP